MRYPLEIDLRPSRPVLILNAAIHSIAAFAFVLSSLHPVLVVAALVLLGLSLRVAIREEGRKDGRRLVLESDGALRVEEGADGRRVVYAVVEASCVDFGWAVWLHWRGARVRRAPRRVLRGAVMLMAGDLPEDEWRGLRIWLRHKTAVGSVKDVGETLAVQRRV